MLRCVFRDIKGQRVIMPRLLSLQVNVDENVPADSLYAVFPCMATDELVGVTLYDGDKPLFIGVVDEEERERGAQGNFLKVSARSLAGLLLDNEAMPCVYEHPSLSLIYERYVKPYGIALDGDDDAFCFGEQSVTKGSSCWRVLKKFCNACYSSTPRVSSVGVLYPKGISRGRVTDFGEGGICYTALREIGKRCEEISTVYVKTSNVGTYSLPVKNPSAAARGVRRERYLNAVLTESPMRCADAMIANGSAKAYEIRLRCPSCLLGREGDRAILRDAVIGERNDLMISAVHYRMTADGEVSSVTLKRRTG